MDSSSYSTSNRGGEGSGSSKFLLSNNNNSTVNFPPTSTTHSLFNSTTISASHHPHHHNVSSSSNSSSSSLMAALTLSSSPPSSSSSSSLSPRNTPSPNTKLLSSIEQFVDKSWSNHAFQNMEEIRRLGKLCDITLMAQSHKYSAHRIVLAASIPYFNAMLLHDLIESKQEVITINNVEAQALEQFINYSYNGKITITNENVQALLIGANFFHLKAIRAACCEYIKKRLSVHEALCVKSFAEQLMCHDLVVSVNRFVNRNFVRITQTPDFLSLTYADMADILGRDELNVDCEEQIYEAILAWIKHDEEKRREHVYDLLRLVRLPLIKPVFIFDTISHEPLIRSDLKSRDLLDEATYYHLLPEKRGQFKTFVNLKPRCCTDSSGLVYAIGGLNQAGGSTVEVYDPVEDSWRLAESMSTTRSRVAVAVLQGKLYAIGGYNGLERLAVVEVFEPEVRKWRRVAAISRPRSALGSAVLNNKLYVCGGYDGYASSDTVEVYDPNADKWSTASSMKKHRSASGITAFNSMIYAAGGHDGYRIYDSVECYDTQADCWSFVAPMKTKRCRLGLTGLNGKLYAAGGYDSLNFLNTVERYDPLEDKWEFVAPMQVKRSRMALITCNSKLYAIGGYDGTANLASVEVYDPESDQWSLVSGMKHHEGVVGVGVLPRDVDYCLSNSSSSSSSCLSSSNSPNGGVVDNLNTSSSMNGQTIKQSKMLNNYYSLMEEEEEEDNISPYTSVMSPINLQQQQQQRSGSQ